MSRQLLVVKAEKEGTWFILGFDEGGLKMAEMKILTVVRIEEGCKAVVI